MKNRFIVNISANVASFIITILVSILIVPFFLHKLGTEAYSFVPLTQQLVGYMDILMLVLNGMIARYFTIAIKSENRLEAQEYFNTSLISGLAASFIIAIPFSILILSINRIVNVPDSLLRDVQVCILMYSLSFMINALSTSFGMATFCENRLEINSAFNITLVVIRTLFTVILLNSFPPHIWFIGLGTFLASVITFGMKIFFFHKLIPGIKINLSQFSMKKLKELMSSSIWNSINQVGTLFFLQIDMLVANWFLGPQIAGEYSAVIQWSVVLRSFVGTVTSVFAPTITAFYAGNKIKELVEYSNKSTKITGLLMALPVGLICGLGGQLLKLWLGPEYARYGYFLSLATFHLSVNLSVQTLFSLFTAVNSIKIPALINVIMGSINFCLAIFFTNNLKMGVYGIALAGAIALTSKNLLFTPIYSAHITGQKWYEYYKGIFKPFIAVCVIVTISFVLRQVIRVNNWSHLFMIGILVFGVYILFAYIVLLDSEDRQQIREILFTPFKALKSNI